MRNLLIAGVVASAAITFAPLAHADAGDFTNYMASHGYPNQGQTQSGYTYLTHGQQACAGLRNGQSEGQMIGQMRQQFGFSRAESDLIVTGAHQYLCPGA
jgi:hypothetical protein